MYEFEVKLKINDKDTLIAHLETTGFTKGRSVREEDRYFNNPACDLKARDEALRVRQSTDLTTGASHSQINFKGPKIDTITISRKEIETGVDNAEAAAEIFKALDYYTLPPVIKIRQYFHKDTVTACVDEVVGLGTFLELEILSETQAHEACLARLDGILESLNLSMTASITQSYLSMLQEKQNYSDADEMFPIPLDTF